MSALRTSNILRRRLLRPVATAPHLRPSQVRFVQYVRTDGEFDDTDGQQVPPPTSGGSEALKRDWIPVGGAALLVLAALSYISSSDKPARPNDAELPSAILTEVRGVPPPSSTAAAIEKLKDKEVVALSELSGRKGGGSMGSFRGE
ncbi:hypothetical protein B0J13DRAFT_534954 [Dactylonectria estremocensis]|uniref:Uncharacterized protein n=1 Tax=Dactylonectria estremocensis TaxID=1079267 RepID=A0A9P9FJ68_9HYPO|nr:hypothetical protein B0J13DRAFT_534954 [Dactylonectria estremocensis]